MTTTLTLEVEVTVNFYHTAGSPSDYWHLGDAAEVDIRTVCIGGYNLPLNCLSCEQLKTIEEAAFAEAGEYEPDYN